MVNEISALELKEKLDRKDDFILLDVRRPDELQICRIEQAMHIEMTDVPNHIDQLDKDKEYVIMCRSGARSMQILAYLQKNEFTNLTNLKGGILGWAEAVDPDMQTY
jgi:adenylyltransferase/sulfurtransferase